MNIVHNEQGGGRQRRAMLTRHMSNAGLMRNLSQMYKANRRQCIYDAGYTIQPETIQRDQLRGWKNKRLDLSLCLQSRPFAGNVGPLQPLQAMSLETKRRQFRPNLG
jgi:hypothetical protein